MRCHEVESQLVKVQFGATSSAGLTDAYHEYEAYSTMA